MLTIELIFAQLYVLVTDTMILRGLSPGANYAGRAPDCRRSWCQLLRIEGVAWLVRRISVFQIGLTFT
jgi:hypothetical protein